ncbi:hypothetical protein EOPP23_06650 [Endozoicomonas sp. OPT23]|uniref:hypothetical protein n=1 Tax=Endozoicomonas sp. OPT23 TaxID=2072845 RepID=UPI00129AB204|nr:hypothetical protein [Endozoicomonas sp. OPT23]MRI32666.1 hypothetical protein [Endozoicomonas sp. OPT23]
MRFSELFNEKEFPNGITSIPAPQFRSMVSDWAQAMGKRCGYKKATRLEHWQEAIDTVYSTLENELDTTDTATIQSHKMWRDMMLAAKLYFPEHINIYHPTIVEQQRTRLLVENSKITRHLRNKAELLSFLKSDKELGVKTLSDLAVSRLQCEVMATSAEILLAQYKSYQNNPGKSFYSGTATAGTSKDGSKGKTGVSGSVGAKASASAQAGYNSGDVAFGSGGHAHLKASVMASADIDTYAKAEAKIDDLKASAKVGIDAMAEVSANVDYGIYHSCNVSVDYLRRTLGDKFKTIEAQCKGKTFASASGSASASANGPGNVTFHHAKDQNKAFNSFQTLNDDDKAKAKGRGKEVFNIASAEVNAEVELKVGLEGSTNLTLLQMIDLELSAEAFVTAAAAGNLKFYVNEQEVGMNIGGSAMAGFEAGTKQKITFKHPSRNVSIISSQVHEAFTAGIGIEGKVSAIASFDQCFFDTSVTTTLGIGAGFAANTVVSPRGLLLLGYDFLAVPTVLALGKAMSRYNNGPHTQRLQKVCDFLNKQASKGEINQVYLDNMTRIGACIASLNNDAERLYKMTQFRAPGVNVKDQYTEMAKGDIADGVKGTSQSTYYDYTTTTNETGPLAVIFGSEADEGHSNISGPEGVGEGMRGQVVVQSFISSQTTNRGDKLSSVVSTDKQALHNAAAAYEQATSNGSGACVAYEVLRRDMLTKKVNYA